jgi:hypothetical protein
MRAGKYDLFRDKIENIAIADDGNEGIETVYGKYGEDFIPSQGWLGHIELK